MKKLLSVIFAITMLVTAVFTVPMTSVAASPSIIPVGRQFVYTGSLSGNVTMVDVNISFDTLGENLITDPTVAEFDGEDNYLDYYNPAKFQSDGDVSEGPINPKAWWARPSILYNGFLTKTVINMYTSAQYSGYTVNDPKLSHTADGSGVLKVTGKRKAQFLPLPELERNSYYMITFWCKSTGSEAGRNINILRAANHNQDVAYASGDTAANPPYGYVSRIAYNGFITHGQVNLVNKWQRYTFVIYTENTAWTQPAISLPGGGDNGSGGNAYTVVHYLDDFGVYKLRDDYGAAVVNPAAAADRVTALNNFTDYYTEYTTAPYGGSSTGIDLNSGYNRKYENIDWSQYGVNICPDSTVSCFTDGVYDDYYEGNYTSANIRFNRTDAFLNPYAIWDKPVDNSNANGTSLYRSPKDRGYLTTEESHTADGSGAIKIGTNDNFLLPMPSLEKFHFYVVTFWIKNTSAGDKYVNFRKVRTDAYNGDPTFNLGAATSSANDYWSRATFLIYAANITNNFPDPAIQFYGVKDALIDEIEVWKITDASLARAWLDNNRLVMRGDVDASINVSGADIGALATEIINGEYALVFASDVNSSGAVDIRDLVDLKKTIVPAA